MKKQLPIGTSDYKQLIDDNCYYIDKTLFIDDILIYGGRVTLLPRPRRFGKTLNLSMARYFFEKTEQSNSYLFEDKKIWQLPERAALQGKFPVIFVTFKDIKEKSWQKAKEKLIEVIIEEYERHNYLLDSDFLTRKQKETYNQIIDQKASEAQYENSLKNLSEHLYRFHQVKPFVLLDEYDSPIHAGFLHNYYSEVLQFISGLMTAVYKDNTYLERGVITGILRIAKEGIFSGLNNLEVFTVVDDFMTDKFGFTQQEVEQLLQDYDLSNINLDFKDWYNGYLIGTIKIYNPWSALNSIKRQGQLMPYWVNTSNNALIYKAVAKVDPIFKEACADLMLGSIVKNVEIIDDTVLPFLDPSCCATDEYDYEKIDPIDQINSVWSLLLFSGYVTPHASRIVAGNRYVDLILPNRELHVLFKKLVQKLFRKNLEFVNVAMLYKSLQQADGALFSTIVSKFILQSMSYHDISADEAENSYHMFILGLLVILSEKYQVQSNRESGSGRFDIMLAPHDTNIPGFVIEFKKKDDDETMSQCADRALEQIKKRNYATQLHQQNIKNIVVFGVALFKKEILLKQEGLSMITQS